MLRSDKKKTESFWALQDIDIDIEKGERIGIIGRNGAGKSTLLKIISRITPPTTGSAVIRGRVGSLLEVGTGFHPELTGRENIFLNGSILGLKKAEISKDLLIHPSNITAAACNSGWLFQWQHILIRKFC
jgi:lipopolysaccharide transport system ATP-binding protein